MSFPFTSGPHRLLAEGCEAYGCASPVDTWPLYQVMIDGVRCSLCSSCILLCHRSRYCCRCFLLFSRDSQTGHYDDGDQLIAPPGLLTVTCKVCRDAVAHVVCLPVAECGGDFVCPACSMKATGRAFTCAPRSGTPIQREGARVLVVAARMALAMQRQEAAAAHAAAERATQEAIAARRSAHDAIGPFVNFDTHEPSWSTDMDMDMDTPLAAELQLPLALEACHLVSTGSTSTLAQSNAPPPPAAHTFGARGATTEPTTVVPAEAAIPSLAPPRRLQLFGVNLLEKSATEAATRSLAPPQKMQPVGDNEVATSATTEAAVPTPPPTRPFRRLRIREVATAAAEAARASPAPPLFPTRARSSSTTAWTRWVSKGKGKAPVVEVDDDDDKDM